MQVLKRYGLWSFDGGVRGKRVCGVTCAGARENYSVTRSAIFPHRLPCCARAYAARACARGKNFSDEYAEFAGANQLRNLREKPDCGNAEPVFNFVISFMPSK